MSCVRPAAAQPRAGRRLLKHSDAATVPAAARVLPVDGVCVCGRGAETRKAVENLDLWEPALPQPSG